MMNKNTIITTSDLNVYFDLSNIIINLQEFNGFSAGTLSRGKVLVYCKAAWLAHFS